MQDMRICPKCGGSTDTYRHLNAKVWCTKCGFVLREEGLKFPVPQCPKEPTGDDIKKAAEHIIAICDRLNVSDSNESRRVAGAYLALREQVDAIMNELEECRSGECYCLERAQAAIKAIEEGQG